MLVSTATTVNIKFGTLDCILASSERFFWRATLDQVLVKMTRKLPADVIQYWSKRVNCYNNGYTDSFEDLPNHF